MILATPKQNPISNSFRVAETAEEEKDMKIYLNSGVLIYRVWTQSYPDARRRWGRFSFKHHLSRPSVFADQLDKTAAPQIDRPDAGAGFFNA